MRLNIGSGDLRAPAPWVNVDAWAGARPDVVADLRRLPWPEGSVDRVYCGHVLEHLPMVDIRRAMLELRRVLRPAGGLCVVGPDYDRAVAGDADPVLLGCIRDGGDRWPGDRHQWLSTETTALLLVRQVFPAAVAVPIVEIGEEWPLPFDVWWQFAIVAAV